jgi:histidine ammonia-lyase
VLEAALVIGALTVDAARGSDGPFDPRIHALRGQPGQIDVAQYYRACWPAAPSAPHTRGDDRVQDPYCLRCQPQVVGACLDQLRHAALVLLREANAVTDNPLVFADDGVMCPAATSTPSRWRWPPTPWPAPSPRWAPSPSAASRC